MPDISLEQLQDKEYALIDGVTGDHFHTHTPVDRYMELNHAGLVEGSEEVTLREKRADRMLRRGSFPSS
jgi:hypothetical protein